MSEPLERQNISGDTEEVDALVVADEPIVSPRERVAGQLESLNAGTQAVQAAAVAATGFLAGAAVVGLVQRRHRRSLAHARSDRRRVRLRSRGADEPVQIVASRSLLVDVHLLGTGRNR
ncbi:MAG TPA: hypothetical protein VGF15_06130 [Solirubrobacteraceae bacterium]